MICGAGSPDYELIAAGFENSEIRLWKRNCLPLTAYQEHLQPMTYLNEYEPKVEEVPAILRGHSNWVTDLHFLQTPNYLLSVSKDSTMRIWNLDELQCKAIYRLVYLYLKSTAPDLLMPYWSQPFMHNSLVEKILPNSGKC